MTAPAADVFAAEGWYTSQMVVESLTAVDRFGGRTFTTRPTPVPCWHERTDTLVAGPGGTTGTATVSVYAPLGAWEEWLTVDSQVRLDGGEPRRVQAVTITRYGQPTDGVLVQL